MNVGWVRLKHDWKQWLEFMKKQ